MYHLRLIKALSYCGAIHATRERPDAYTEDEAVAESALASGYFELVEITQPEVEEDAQGNDIPDGIAVHEGDAQGEEDGDEEEGPSMESTPDFETLATMTKAELTAFAKERDIDVSRCRTKDDILGAISVAYGGSYTMIDLQHE